MFASKIFDASVYPGSFVTGSKLTIVGATEEPNSIIEVTILNPAAILTRDAGSVIKANACALASFIPAIVCAF